MSLDAPLLDVVSSDASDLPSPKAGKTCKRVNSNVIAVLMLVGHTGLADSVWGGTVLVAYVYALTGQSNTMAGVLEAMSGVVQLITALPVGYLADRWGRGPVCKVGAITLLVACACTAVAVENPMGWSNTAVYWTLCFAMCVWGICEGVVWGPAQALFADSVVEGERSAAYTFLMLAYMLPNALGPAVCVGLFAVWGDSWSLSEIRLPFIVGICLEIPCALWLLVMSDSKALKEPGTKEEEEEEDDDNDSTTEGKETKEVEDGTEHTEEEAVAVAVRPAEAISEQNPFGAAKPAIADDASPPPAASSCGCLRKAHIPYILFSSDMCTALASGMTVKFFPLFFKNDLELAPSRVQLIYVFTPISIALFSVAAQAMSKRCKVGRVQTVLLMTVFGVSLLVALAILFDGGGVGDNSKRNTGWRSAWYVIVPVYIARTSCMNCTYPLQESIMMDSVPKSTRARWKSLESVSTLGWCGSAVLGGVLADKFGYTFSFLLTAAMQAFGGCVFALLLPLVPREEGSGGGEKKDEEET